MLTLPPALDVHPPAGPGRSTCPRAGAADITPFRCRRAGRPGPGPTTIGRPRPSAGRFTRVLRYCRIDDADRYTASRSERTGAPDGIENSRTGASARPVELRAAITPSGPEPEPAALASAESSQAGEAVNRRDGEDSAMTRPTAAPRQPRRPAAAAHPAETLTQTFLAGTILSWDAVTTAWCRGLARRRPTTINAELELSVTDELFRDPKIDSEASVAAAFGLRRRTTSSFDNVDELAAPAPVSAMAEQAARDTQKSR